MKVAFHPAAEAEFSEAIDYYDEIEPGLGRELAVEVYSAIQRAVTYPTAWPILEGDVRRSLLRRFPYGVLYSAQENEVFILAIMHLKRDPDYWKSRQ